MNSNKKDGVNAGGKKEKEKETRTRYISFQDGGYQKFPVTRENVFFRLSLPRVWFTAEIY